MTRNGVWGCSPAPGSGLGVPAGLRLLLGDEPPWLFRFLLQEGSVGLAGPTGCRERQEPEVKLQLRADIYKCRQKFSDTQLRPEGKH